MDKNTNRHASLRRSNIKKKPKSLWQDYLTLLRKTIYFVGIIGVVVTLLNISERVPPVKRWMSKQMQELCWDGLKFRWDWRR